MLVALLMPASAGEKVNCIPWSVLAAQEGFTEQLDKLAKQKEQERSVLAGNEALPSPTLMGSLPFPLENNCRMQADFRSDAEALSFWNALGPLRFNTETSLPVLRRIAETPQAFDYLVRLPSIAGWDEVAYHFASGAFERLDVSQEEFGPELQNLHAAAKRWPNLARRWLSLQRSEDRLSSYFQAITQAVGDLEEDEEPQNVNGGTPIIPMIMPHQGRGARTARAIKKFLRIYGARVQWDLILTDIAEENAGPEDLAELQSKGANPVAIVGPLVRQNLELPVLTESGNKPVFFRLGAQQAGSAENGSFRLGPQLSDQLRAHALNAGGILKEPLLVIGPPGKKIEQWRIAADEVLGVDEDPRSMGAMVLTYDPKETNLSSYADFVRQSAPGTIILAVPHTDVDRVLRYLARAGVWASRKGKQIRKGELHPVIIGPSSLGLDRKLKQRNRDYLDGVRIASDVVMIENWIQWPGVEEYIAQEKAYPPIAALRIAAALDRVQWQLSAQQEVSGNNAGSWLPGESTIAPLELSNGALAFPMKIYIFSGKQFTTQQ